MARRRASSAHVAPYAPDSRASSQSCARRALCATRRVSLCRANAAPLATTVLPTRSLQIRWHHWTCRSCSARPRSSSPRNSSGRSRACRRRSVWRVYSPTSQWWAISCTRSRARRARTASGARATRRRKRQWTWATCQAQCCRVRGATTAPPARTSRFLLRAAASPQARAMHSGRCVCRAHTPTTRASRSACRAQPGTSAPATAPSSRACATQARSAACATRSVAGTALWVPGTLSRVSQTRPYASRATPAWCAPWRACRTTSPWATTWSRWSTSSSRTASPAPRRARPWSCSPLAAPPCAPRATCATPAHPWRVSSAPTGTSAVTGRPRRHNSRTSVRPGISARRARRQADGSSSRAWRATSARKARALSCRAARRAQSRRPCRSRCTTVSPTASRSGESRRSGTTSSRPSTC
mmetsp:Transcript_2788/g.9813  ORF Transcript_2788/g.9813 Transcript_2788/m.9813 type:complete len:414 (-) Transcript_2788:4336-5577(-)